MLIQLNLKSSSQLFVTYRVTLKLELVFVVVSLQHQATTYDSVLINYQVDYVLCKTQVDLRNAFVKIDSYTTV